MAAGSLCARAEEPRQVRNLIPSWGDITLVYGPGTAGVELLLDLLDDAGQELLLCAASMESAATPAPRGLTAARRQPSTGAGGP